ncbi:MAG: nascent polypeptide-associated complex protein [Thermoplasmata archaeon]|nr:MAG: nascent polypeptide-associated complex protein [Thermoplasmata archaeon]KAA0008318.1 MAG: nascent polypeptide-associated complex protein [Thermoplasmata archaeon]MCD6572909.1 nascent polypeptide-associated complex protein [Thermoplasmata archaeon]
MLPMDERQMKKLMKRMGINVKELEAERVIIETKDKKYIFLNPDVSIMEIKGQQTYQIVGKPEIISKISEEDAKLVAEKTGKSIEEARKALEEANGDIAQAILNLSS